MRAKIAPKGGSDDTRLWKPVIEFRSTADDAWYPVRISLHGETLVITFPDYPGEADKERFFADDFTTRKDIEDFRLRFRHFSPQVQDDKCHKVRRGGRVCALCEHKDVRLYYDARVDDEKRVPHTFTKDGEEECRCEFILEWLHGPRQGTITSSKIGNICHIMLESKILDQSLTSFLSMLDVKVPISGSPGARDKSGCGGYEEEIDGSEISDDADMGGGEMKYIICQENNNQLVPAEDAHVDFEVAVGYDEDLGHHHILIDNLEKDLHPAVVETFIFKHTSVHAKAYVLPSLRTETYTRGMLAVYSAENVEKVRSFLQQSDRMIVSSKGRPWVVPDQDQYESSNFEDHSIVAQAEVGEELKIVQSGTLEYNRAWELQKIKGIFADHQSRLHRRLEMEEEKIMSMSGDLV